MGKPQELIKKKEDPGTCNLFWVCFPDQYELLSWIKG